MRHNRILAALCLILVAAPAWWANSATQEKAEYQLVAGWPKLPANVKLDITTAVAADKDDNLYVFNRGEKPILVFDKDGTFLRSWGDKLFDTAHGLRIDADGNIWTTDLGHHTVVKFDPKGNVLLTLGKKGKKGPALDRFNMPADIAFSAAGDIYVADGYGNSRVMKFDKTGKYLKHWGKKGKAPGEFNLVHAVRVDGEGRVYVGDRENNRVQVFDADGAFLHQFPETGGPYGLFLTKDNDLLIASGRSNLAKRADVKGKLAYSWGAKGDGPGQFLMPHGITGDSLGNVYVAEGDGHRVQKFRRQ